MYFEQFKQPSQSMQGWAQLCNMRSSLLHLQFIYCSLSERINEQRSRIDRAHKDRLMQYGSLWEEFISVEQTNFKRLVIMKLESCLNLYANDERAWEMMDSFMSYASAVEHDLMDNISKLYIGKRVMLDIKEVEEQLKKIEEKITAFMGGNRESIHEYNRNVKAISDTREVFAAYLGQIRTLYEEVNNSYHIYLSKKLHQRMKEISQQVLHLKNAIYR